MRARQYKRVYEAAEPVKRQVQGEAPKKPGWFAGRERREQYQDEVATRLAQEAAAQEKYIRDIDQYNRQVDLNNRQLDSNRRAAERRQMMKHLPDPVKQNVAAQILGDRVVDARRLGQEAVALPGRIHPGYYVGGAAAIGSAGLLNAYSQLQDEGQASGVFPTVGRATANLLNPGREVGVDPLAAARNGVREAQGELESSRLLEALVLDEIDAYEAGITPDGSGAVTTADFEFEAAVDRKANELMSMPKVNADGSMGFMSPEAAYSQARQIMELEMRY